MTPIPRNELIHWNEISFFRNGGGIFSVSGNKRWFAYGRQALKAGLTSLGLAGNDKVLVPDYICNVVESSFHPDRGSITYYRIDEQLAPDFGDIEKKLDRHTKALLCVNYFGHPAPFSKIRAFCREHRLLFIEDNAHGFLSRHNGRWLGEFGDISITSARKTVPLLHGAYLQNNLGSGNRRDVAGSFYVDKTFLRYFYRYLKRYMARNILHEDPGYSCKWVNSSNPLPDPLMDVRLHRLALLPLRYMNYEALYRNRMDKYRSVMRFIKADLQSIGAPLLAPPATSVLPLQIPFLLEIGEREKKSLVQELSNNGIEVFRWPDLPEEIMDNPGKYPCAQHFKENLIHFPV